MKWVLKLARSRFGRFCVSFLFTHMSFVIPVKRLRETENLLAFHHPQPSYATHILIVPKRPYTSLMDVETADIIFLTDLFQTVQNLVHEFQLENGYRLITNGGAYQDVPHLHFHLVGGDL